MSRRGRTGPPRSASRDPRIKTSAAGRTVDRAAPFCERQPRECPRDSSFHATRTRLAAAGSRPKRWRCGSPAHRLGANVQLDVLLAATNDDVIAGFKRSDLIAIGALLVSLGAAAISVHTWRRAPGSKIELRETSVDRDPAGRLRLTCIARNRSPHAAVQLTRGNVRCRPAAIEGASITMGPISVGADLREPARQDRDSGISLELGGAGFSVALGPGRGETVVAVVVEVELLPEGHRSRRRSRPHRASHSLAPFA